MISIPALERIDVDGYGLYPGQTAEQPGLHAALPSGLVLVVGANGLGKTTLITLLYRMLSGPFDIPSLGAGEELGTRRLEATALSPTARGIFASRVADRAIGAKATLQLRFGDTSILIERSLANLALIRLEVAGERVEGCNEETFQDEMAKRAGVGSFGDFLLLLRYLVFYFEDRRALVWDQSAQRQLLRMLFLPPDVAQQWTVMERSILVKDSDVRNFSAVVGRQEKELTANLYKAQSAIALRAELASLEAVQQNDRDRLQQIAPLVAELDRDRQNARNAHMKAQQEREARFRAVEEAKLLAIQARFPEQAATGRYILAHLMSEQQCLVCGTHTPEAAECYTQRITDDRCVVCSTPLSGLEGVVEERTLADGRVAKRDAALANAEKELAGAAANRIEAEARFGAHREEVTQLDGAIAERAARIDQIVAAMPPSERTLRDRRDELAILRNRLEERRHQLVEERAAFANFVAERTEELLRRSGSIVREFEDYARGFLSERISLTWSEYRARLGQTGDLIAFPSFELDMSGSDFAEAVRRSGPGAVSESQREFIDLAFRMALMRVASGDGSGTLVIDTPESSLDAVFAKRAADILLRFAAISGNHLLVTSNLVEGTLLPTLAAAIASGPEPRSRLVDLFAIARPTAALIAQSDEYAEVKRRLLGSALS